MHPMVDDKRVSDRIAHGLFVGRQREVLTLWAALEDMLAGRGGLVMLVGEPGIGKTRTAQQFAVYVAQRGAQVLWGRCDEEPGAPPFWPWVQALRTYVQAHDTSTLRAEMGDSAIDIAEIVPDMHARLPDLQPPPHVEDPAQARFRLFDSVRSFLQQAARRQPLVLFLDNLHWADAPSLRLLAFLAPELESSQILVVGSYRDMELSRQHPLSHTLGELMRQPRFQRLRLRGLGQEDVGHFLKLVLGRPPEQELVAALHSQTEGNPLFLTEIVRFLIQEGVLTPERAHLHPPPCQNTGANLRIRIPEGIRDVIGQRLNRLSAGCNRMLSMAAVIGRQFRLEEVSAVLDGESEEGVLEMLEEAVAAGVIEEMPHARGHHQFTHALIRETLYDELTTARRARLHRRIGEAMEALYAAHLEPHLTPLAHHFAEAAQNGGADKATAYAEQAGARSMALLAYEEAVRFYRVALDALDLKDPTDTAHRCRLLLALGDAQRKAGELPEAMATFQRAAGLAREQGFAEELARAVLEFEQVTWLTRLPAQPAVSLLQDALHALATEDSALRARTLGGLARALLFTGSPQQGAVFGRQALEMSRRVNDPAAVAFNLHVMLDILRGPEKTEERLGYATEMLRLSEEAKNNELIPEAHFWRLSCLLELGAIQGLDAAVDVHVRLSEALRQPFYDYIATGIRAMRALLQGGFAESEQLARQALSLGRQVRAENVEGAFGLQMFTLRREQGRLAELKPVVQGFIRQHTATAAWRPGLALIYCELGLREEARSEFEKLAKRDFADLPRDALWSTCLTYLAQVCVFLGDAERASTLYGLLRPYTGRAVVAGGAVVCYGATDRYLGLLTATMGQWAATVQHFEDALALNTHMGARPWLAHTQHDYAVMLLARNQTGDQEKAMALLNEALASARALGMHALEARAVARLDRIAAPTPTLPTYPDNLSPREVEVLRLLAIGKSNRDVADSLCISLSTVATHVRSILSKTSSANRTEAAAYALRQGLVEE
jgi:DNA-binding CsgD family transcriptional regulator/tetratricopeptide (TPR) repeat protein